MSQIVDIPHYTDLKKVETHSQLMKKYYCDDLIVNLRKLYIDDQRDFNLFLKELYIRGISFKGEWNTNLFHKIEYNLYPYIYVEDDKKRFESLSLNMFSLSNLISDHNINSDLFFNYMPLEGFYKYIPKEKREYFKRELLSSGFELVYSSNIKSKKKVLTYVNGFGYDMDKLIFGDEFDHFKNFCKYQKNKNYRSFKMLIEDYKKREKVSKTYIKKLYEYFELNNMIKPGGQDYRDIFNNELRYTLEENNINYADFINIYFSEENLQKDEPYKYGLNLIERLSSNSKDNNVNLDNYYKKMNESLTNLKNHMNYKLISHYRINEFVKITKISNLFRDDKRYIYELGNQLEDYTLIEIIIDYIEKVFKVSEIKTFIDQSLNDNQKKVISGRARGETLGEIGINIGVTRERVRQIQEKVRKNIISNGIHNTIETLLLLLFTKNNQVHIDELENVLNIKESNYLIKLILEKSEKFIIIDELDIILLKTHYSRIKDYVSSKLNDDTLVIKINEIPFIDKTEFEILKFIFNEFNYIFAEDKFVQNSISIVRAIEYIFDNNRNEIITNNEDGFIKVKNLIKSMLGMEITSNQRSLFSRVASAENVILVDRNTYKYDDFSEVDKQFISQLKEIIDEGLTNYPYVDPRDIFNNNHTLMIDNKVNSYTHLYSIIKNFYEDEYKIGYQNTLYIYEKDAKSLSSEEILMKYIEKNSPANVKTLLNDLKWSNTKLEQLIARMNDILINGFNDVVSVKGIEDEPFFEEVIDLIKNEFNKEYIYTVDLFMDMSLDDKYKPLLEKYHIDNLYGFSQFIKSKLDNIRGQKQFLYVKDSKIRKIEDVITNELPNIFSNKELEECIVYKGYSRQKYYQTRDNLIEDNKIAPYDNDLFLNLKDTVFDEDILQEVKKKADKLLQDKIYLNKNDLEQIDINYEELNRLTPNLIAYLLEINGYSLIEAYQGSKYELPIVSKEFKTYEDVIYYELENNYRDAYESNVFLNYLKSKLLVNIKADRLYYVILNLGRLNFDDIGYFTFERGEI
ncbi:MULTISPECIES: sigma factor-like helix-turn-helix DNA-binding protein [unclassified Mammaliicoccus]|uniref:sigma factor-like helix-turn-helix DNA-binding protein n=1 Tax=unclassified Mammaliicoccus TaxID=2803851 RepID=UPI001EFA8154|nr:MULTISPECIES: sigma factor-like helix-turn-helix DNA-binding protein [unclassified Mammaliicoccus]